MSQPSWVGTDPLTLLRDSGYAPPEPADFTEKAMDLSERTAMKWLSKDSAQTYVNQSRRTGDNRVRDPQSVLGERYVRLAICLLAQIRGEPPTTGMSEDAKEPMTLRQTVGFCVRAISAGPYLWTDRIIREVTGMESPRQVISRSILREPRMWWTFESAHAQLTTAGEDTGSIGDATLVSDEGQFMQVTSVGAWGDIYSSDIRIWGFPLPYGATYPDDFEEAERPAVGALLSWLGFLNSPYVPKAPRPSGRAERRRAMRDGDDLDSVTFVDLREAVPGLTHESDEAQDVNWKHQWIVRGHLRAQWYPSERAHRVIYIPPYIKGPAGAPMLEHAYRVRR